MAKLGDDHSLRLPDCELRAPHHLTGFEKNWLHAKKKTYGYRFTKPGKICVFSLQVRGLEPTLKQKNRPNCQLLYKKNNLSWGDFSGGWQIFRALLAQP
ncbi:MAG: hypothetical protein PUP92_02165 [Rhizonema sp. PD38]|nr:hypothetical protein [Rhizonema sp. PD38]